MIADESRPTLGIGTPDSTVLDAEAFHLAILSFIERELPVWRDRPTRPQFDDEANLNQTLCLHLNSASRRQSFDAVQFLQEPLQIAGRRADIGAFPLGTIMVEGRNYEDYEQLLPIECKRLPTPKDKRRSDCEYVHGLPGHRTGAIERFKHGLHGATNPRALIIAFVQAESCSHWLRTINSRLGELATASVDEMLWSPAELLFADSPCCADPNKFSSQHRRIQSTNSSVPLEITHLWLQMN